MSKNDVEKMKKFLEEKKSKGNYLQAEKRLDLVKLKR